MIRDELIEAGARALVAAQVGVPTPATDTDRRIVRPIFDAIEPLIRADEQEKCAAKLDDMDYFMVNTRAKTLADLRAKVAALHDTPEGEYGLYTLALRDVLALIDGGSG